MSFIPPVFSFRFWVIWQINIFGHDFVAITLYLATSQTWKNKLVRNGSPYMSIHTNLINTPKDIFPLNCIRNNAPSLIQVMAIQGITKSQTTVIVPIRATQHEATLHRRTPIQHDLVGPNLLLIVDLVLYSLFCFGQYFFQDLFLTRGLCIWWITGYVSWQPVPLFTKP